MKVSTADSTEALLITACLATDDNLESAFRDFEKFGSLDDLNEGTLRLVPYLYRRLEKRKIPSVRLGILKGIYSRYWYLHHMFRSTNLELCQRILEGIPFLVLKGRAFQHLLYGEDAPTRPTDDTDILVHPKNRREVFQRFLTEGFETKFPRLHDEVLMLGPSMGLEKDGTSIDVHWGFYPPVDHEGLVDEMFKSSIPLLPGNGGTRTLCISHHFLHTLVHGWGRNEVSPIRWVLDASLLARNPDIDWDYMTSEARASGWSAIASRQLQFLSSKYEVKPPEHVVPLLSRAPRSPLQMVTLVHTKMRKSVLKKVISLVAIRPHYFAAHAKTDGDTKGQFWARALLVSLKGIVFRTSRWFSKRRKISP